MATIKIRFENKNHLKDWLQYLEGHLKDINLANAPRQPNSVFWASDAHSPFYESLTRDYIFDRFNEYPNGLALKLQDEIGNSAFVLSVCRLNPLNAYLTPSDGFSVLMDKLKSNTPDGGKFACGTPFKEAIPSPIRFVIANMPTYVSAMVEGKLLPREDEINGKLWRVILRNFTMATKEDGFKLFSSYGILAFVLNHVRWDDLGLREILKPIYDHWKGLGTSSNPQSVSAQSQYVATSGTISLPDSEPTTITIPNPNGRGNITRWIRTSEDLELNPQLMSGSVYSDYRPDFDPLP